MLMDLFALVDVNFGDWWDRVLWDSEPQIRKLSYTITNSPTKVDVLWTAACDRLGLEKLRLFGDEPTRWGSTKRMLDRALAYKSVVNEVCRNKLLRQYEIEEAQWDALENLRDLMKVCPFVLSRLC